MTSSIRSISLSLGSLPRIAPLASRSIANRLQAVHSSPNFVPRLPVPSRVSRRSYSSSSRASPPPPRQRGFPLSPALASSLALFLGGGGGLYWYSNLEEPSVLAPDRWTPVKIESVERLTRDTCLFRIRVPKSILPKVLLQDQGAKPILSLFVKEPSLQIQRAYTPLSASCFNPDGSVTLELVVKRYPDGEISRYLHRLRAGDEISIRAPSVTWYYRPSDWDEVVFIAGGTGVTPAYQLINDSLTRASSTTSSNQEPTLSLLYASSSPADTFLRTQLERFESSKAARIQFHVDRPTSQEPTLPPNTKLGRIDRAALEEFVGKKDPTKRRVFVVCGPEGMIEAIAGPRGRNFSQGPVGGVLRELGYTDSRQVVKL